MTDSIFLFRYFKFKIQNRLIFTSAYFTDDSAPSATFFVFQPTPARTRIIPAGFIGGLCTRLYLRLSLKGLFLSLIRFPFISYPAEGFMGVLKKHFIGSTKIIMS